MFYSLYVDGRNENRYVPVGKIYLFREAKKNVQVL